MLKGIVQFFFVVGLCEVQMVKYNICSIITVRNTTKKSELSLNYGSGNSSAECVYSMEGHDKASLSHTDTGSDEFSRVRVNQNSDGWTKPEDSWRC